MNLVHITVTNRELGISLISPYSHGEGLQRKPDGSLVLYFVPLYELKIDGGSTYFAIRFGLVNRGEASPPMTRKCDAGLSLKQTRFPLWVIGYSPHSFAGESRKGAFRLIAEKGFLIHEGPDAAKDQVGGSLGCIEVIGGKWNDFLNEIESVGGSSCQRLCAADKVKVSLEPAPFPTAILVNP